MEEFEVDVMKTVKDKREMYLRFLDNTFIIQVHEIKKCRDQETPKSTIKMKQNNQLAFFRCTKCEEKKREPVIYIVQKIEINKSKLINI